MSNPMHGDLVELRIRVQPDVAAWLKQEARQLGNLVRPETVAATMLERAVDAKKFQRAPSQAAPEPSQP